MNKYPAISILQKLVKIGGYSLMLGGFLPLGISLSNGSDYWLLVSVLCFVCGFALLVADNFVSLILGIADHS